MNDILRFRINRSPQHKATSDSRVFDPFLFGFGDGHFSKEEGTALANDSHTTQVVGAIGVHFKVLILPLPTPAQKRASADAIWASPYCLRNPDSTPLTSVAPKLDEWLRAHGDKPKPKALAAELERLAAGVAARSLATPGAPPVRIILLDPMFWVDWIRLTASLAVNLYFNFFDIVSINQRGLLVRYLLVYSLLADLDTPNRNWPGADAVHTLLHKTRLLLTPALLAHLKRTNPSIRKPAFTDLFVIREQWKSYEAGEIAHIENILPHELKERLHERLDESEEITQEENFRSEISQKDSESTDRFELQATASQEFQAALNVDFSTDTSTVAPGVVNDTHIGGGADVSYAQAATRASQTSREVITRTLNRVQADVRKFRQARTLTKVTQRDRHELNNTSEHAIAGVYRWLDKIKQMTLVRYPNRFVIELQIPEPGAWTRWLLRRGQMSSGLPLDPGPFDQLEPQRISFDDDGKPTDYRHLAAVYEARGVQPPPAAIKLGATIINNPGDTEDWVKWAPGDEANPPDFHYFGEKSLTVPTGWIAMDWSASITASDQTKNPANNPLMAQVSLIVGENGDSTGGFENHIVNRGAGNQTAGSQTFLQGTVGNISTGVVPVSVETVNVLGLAINIVVTCEPAPETIILWQMETLQALREGHARLRQRFLDAKALQETTQGVTVDTLPPAQARQLVINELKRQALPFLIGGDFVGRGGCIKRDQLTGEPSPDLPITAQIAPEIQFLESVFEWSNLSWMFYPYYWAAHGTWPDLALNQSADPDFDSFLNAGSARVTLSVRPGFEAQAQLYLDYGILWGGGAMPSPNDPDYLSVSEEIRTLQTGAPDGVVVDHWDVRLPTTLLLLDVNASFPLRNPDVPCRHAQPVHE